MSVKRDSAPPAALFGLVVAGGDSRRMGVDKGTLRYCEKPQVTRLFELVGGYVEQTFVSVNAGQRSHPIYSHFPLIVDEEPRRGPASGLLAAHSAYPDVAWLVAAVDLAHLDEGAIAALARDRRPGAAATVMRHPDGTIEPLFAIWEPVILTRLAEHVERGDASPRRCLEAADTATILCANPEVLESVDTPADHDRVGRHAR